MKNLRRLATRLHSALGIPSVFALATRLHSALGIPSVFALAIPLLSALAIPLLLPIGACGTFLEDNGTHLAYALEKGVSELKTSGANELVVHYTTLDAKDRSYYVELTPSLDPARPAEKHWSSYIVVSGKTSGGTSYHNRFVFVPERLHVEKEQGGTTDLVLRKVGGQIHVVEIR